MKKLTALWLSLLLAFGTLTGCAGQIGIIGGEDGPTAIITSDSASAVSITEAGTMIWISVCRGLIMIC